MYQVQLRPPLDKRGKVSHDAVMKRLSGNELAAAMRAELGIRIKNERLAPGLGVVLVGHNPASELYVSMKEKAAAECGITTRIERLSETCTTEDIQHIVEALNNDPSVHGILVQLPLPSQIDTQAVTSAISPKKDVDGFHPDTVQALYAGEPTFISPVHEAVLRLIASSGESINATKSVIIGNSEVFTQPLKHLLEKAGCFVSIQSPDELRPAELKTAKIIVCAVGRIDFLTSELIPDGAIVIDVGTNKNAEGKTVGDVDVAHLQDRDIFLSPVPGGVGPLTIALLLKNVVCASRGIRT